MLTPLRQYATELFDELAPRQVEAAVADAQADGWSIDAPDNYCPRCGATVDASAVTAGGCLFCLGRRFAWQRLTRLGEYHEPMNDWVKAMKFGGQWRFGPWFGRQLGPRVGPALDDAAVLVVPVPMHWWRRTMRGFDQAKLMAQALAEARGWTYAPVLHRPRHAPPQSLLAPSQRHANIRGCFAARPVDLAGAPVVLVDDVKTTGATLGACARLLRKHGASVVHAAVAAVADPQGQRFETIK